MCVCSKGRHKNVQDQDYMGVSKLHYAICTNGNCKSMEFALIIFMQLTLENCAFAICTKAFYAICTRESRL